MKCNQASNIPVIGLLLFFAPSAYSKIDNVAVSPTFGVQGTQFTFSVTLDAPLPKNYKIRIDLGSGDLRSMTGSGTQYRISQKIYHLTGKQYYIVGLYDAQGVLQARDSGSYTVNSKNNPLATQNQPKTLLATQDSRVKSNARYLAKMNFTKINGDGVALEASAPNWLCVKDNLSGLIWEIKTTDLGLHDGRHTYSWYNPDDLHNGGSVGTEKSTDCTDNQCNTASYVKQVNAVGYCGHHNWRLPTMEELQSIVDYRHYFPSIDTTYFPDLQNPNIELAFWSATPYADSRDSAWSIFFYDGYSNVKVKHNNLSVRLVSN